MWENYRGSRIDREETKQRVKRYLKMLRIGLNMVENGFIFYDLKTLIRF